MSGHVRTSQEPQNHLGPQRVNFNDIDLRCRDQKKKNMSDWYLCLASLQPQGNNYKI